MNYYLQMKYDMTDKRELTAVAIVQCTEFQYSASVSGVIPAAMLRRWSTNYKVRSRVVCLDPRQICTPVLLLS